MVPNPRPSLHPPLWHRDLPAAEGPWVCLPLVVKQAKNWLILPGRSISDSIRLGFVEDAELVKRRLSGDRPGGCEAGWSSVVFERQMAGARAREQR